jgi:hypothetical protein
MNRTYAFCFEIAFLLSVSTARAGYDVATRLETDLRKATTIQLCESVTGGALKPYLTIKAPADIKAITESLRLESFAPRPNAWKGAGAPLLVAFIDAKGAPLFLTWIYPIGDSLTTIEELKRDSKGRLISVSSNIHNDPPNYSASGKSFRQTIYAVFAKLAPKRSKKYWHAPF